MEPESRTHHLKRENQGLIPSISIKTIKEWHGIDNMQRQKCGAVVVGSGIMGRDIAAVFLTAGWSVQVVAPNKLRWKETTIQIEQSVRQIDGSGVDSLRFVSQIEELDWAAVSIVLEAVPEALSLKQAIFAELDRLAPLSVVFGSNSSSLRISDISAGCSGAGRMANTHFFQPAHLVPLVEIAKGENTKIETMNTLYDIFAEIGRAPVRVNRDLPGFLANRIQHALMREAFSVIDEGLATAEDVDIAVQFGFGFRYAAAGPMLLKEFAGFDTQYAAASAIYPSLCNDPAPGKTLSELVALKHFGVKAKKGLRDWTDESIAFERQRYEGALIEAAKILGKPILKAKPLQKPDDL